MIDRFGPWCGDIYRDSSNDEGEICPSCGAGVNDVLRRSMSSRIGEGRFIGQECSKKCGWFEVVEP